MALRGDLDDVGVRRAGNRKRRPVAGRELDAAGRLDVDCDAGSFAPAWKIVTRQRFGPVRK
jgi:hypothetical protein